MEDNSGGLRAGIAQLNTTQSGLARLMKYLGDDREEKNILRSIQRMVSGDARLSGEMRALTGLLMRLPEDVRTNLVREATRSRGGRARPPVAP